MRKGMLSGLWSLKWVLLCLLLTGCPKPDPPPPPPSPEITVTGKIMLGPVVGGHSLQIVIYDTEMNVLNRPKIGLDGGYGFTLKDYEGAVIAQVTSTNSQQECSVGDYIDEATAKPKCLGNNSILSSTVLKLDNTSSDNQAKLHTTSVTTIAALNAGINIKEDGTIAVNDNLSPEIIDRSNKIISQALGLGDQSVAEYTPKSIITTDQKFQSGDAYSQALAEISGIEAEGKSLNSIVEVISAGIGKNGKLSPAVQDMMVKGNQKVFKTAKEQGADTSILNQINKRQDTYPDSIAKVDMVNAPEPPDFNNKTKTKTKTSNQKPTWEWISGGTGNNRYQYRFGAEDDIQNVRGWTETSSSSFTSKDNLKPGKYILEIQEGHTSDQTVWSPASNKIIEIVENQKGSVAIQGEAIQGKMLLAVPNDKDGILRTVEYQWYRENQPIINATDSEYALTEDDVNTAIMVKVSYIDNIDYAERDIHSAPVKVDNIDDKPVLNKLDDVVLKEDAATQVIALVANDIDNDDKAITYNIDSNNSEIAKVTLIATNELRITPIPNKHGTSTITVTAISNGLKDEKTFNIIIKNTDDAPTLIAGKSIISGSPKQGGTLTADPTVISDADGIIENSYTYEWNANDEVLKDETGHTIALTQDHVGKQISVKVSYTDSYGGDYKESAKTNAIANKEDHPTLIAGKSIIRGFPKQGGTLTADPTVISDADGIIENSYTYEWNANDELLRDETGHTIALTQDHVGKQISVKVSYRDSYGKDYIESEKTLDVVNTNDQPEINSDPKLEAEEDKQYTYQLEVTDADIDSRAKYKLVKQENASKMKISNKGLITWTPENKDRNYTADVTVEVDDGTETSNATKQQIFTINVKATDDAPILNTKLTTRRVDENSELIEIILDTTDIDNEKKAITYQATSSDNNIATVAIKNENKLNIRPVKYKHGEVKIKVTAVSNGKWVEKDFQLIIKNKNDAPMGGVTIKPSNQPYRKFSAEVSSIDDPDGIASFSYQWKANNYKISGAVKNEFIPTDEEIGKQISVVVNIEDRLGNKHQFISDKTPSLKVNGIPPTVEGATEMGAEFKEGDFDINKTLSDANFISQYNISSTPLTFVITELPSRGVIISNDGSKISKIENGKYLEVSEGFKYKRTSAGKDSFKYKGKRENILSLKPATINISYHNKAPNVSSFKISAAVEKETRSIPFSENITDDQDATESIIITDPPQLGNLYINGEILDTSKLEKLIDINSNVTYKSIDTLNSFDSFKYKAIDTDDMRSYKGSVRIELKINNKAPKIHKESTQTNVVIDKSDNPISFEFSITDDSSSYDAYNPMFLSTKGNTSQPLWISINTDKQSDSPVNYTVNATLNDKSYANDSIRVLIPVVDDLGLKSKYAFVINPELSVDTQNKFIQKNNTTWVDVCWQFSETTANLDSTKITEIKKEIMNTISNSWQKNSALKFDWREDDWDALQDGKGQLFKWDSPSNCAENYTAEYAQLKVYIKQKEEVDSIEAENRFTINLNVNADGSFEDAYPKHRIIHEFGHALGFPDENRRFDTFRSASSQVSQLGCNQIMDDYDPKFVDENQNIARNSVKKITHKKWQKQLFYSFSIMNECVFLNSEIMEQYDFTTLISGSKLGFNDINRLQYVYGAPATAETSHLIKADQFFTGLYLDGDEYKYYENGIANSSYSPIEKYNLQRILSSNYHFSITNNEISVKTKTVLFKHEATTLDYPEFIPRETSPAAACLKTGTNSQDNNNQQKIQFDLYCDTIESVATDKLITEERSIYYKAGSLLAIQMFYCKTKKEDTTIFKEQFTDNDVCLDLTDNFAATLSTNNTHNLFSNGKKEIVFWLIETNQ